MCLLTPDDLWNMQGLACKSDTLENVDIASIVFSTYVTIIHAPYNLYCKHLFGHRLCSTIYRRQKTDV